MERLDELHDMMYRLNHLTNPDPKIQNAITKEIETCVLSNAHQSTNTDRQNNSHATPEKQKQLTLL